MQLTLLFSRGTPREIVDVLEDFGAVKVEIVAGAEWLYPSEANPELAFALRSDIAGSRQLCVETMLEWYSDLADPLSTWLPLESRLGARPSVFLLGTVVNEKPAGIADLWRLAVTLLRKHDGILDCDNGVCTSDEIRSQGPTALHFSQDWRSTSRDRRLTSE